MAPGSQRTRSVAPRLVGASVVPLVILTAVVAAGCAGRLGGRTAAAPADSSRVLRDVAWLASDALGGRPAGSAESDSAAGFVARRFAALGLAAPARPGCDAAAPRARCFLQRFPLPGGGSAHNVVALIPGTDQALANEYLVLGAHFDHIGRMIAYANDWERGHIVRNGADDNASGTAAVLELARRFRAHPTRRTIVVVAFDAEEEGLLGSEWFVEHPPVPLERVEAMLNFDMVGRLSHGRLDVFPTGAPGLVAIVDSANAGLGLRLRTTGASPGRSDQISFAVKGIPALHFFTGLHADYHRATDDADRINGPGLLRVIDLAERVARTMADGREELIAGR